MKGIEADRPPSKANFVVRIQVFRLYLSSPPRHHIVPVNHLHVKKKVGSRFKFTVNNGVGL